MVYKVTTNTELANTESFLLEEIQQLESCKPLATLSSYNPYIILFYVCFCVKTPDLTYTAHSLMLNSWLIGLQLKSDEYLICVFSIRHVTILCLGLWTIVQRSVWEAFYFGLTNQCFC